MPVFIYRVASFYFPGLPFYLPSRIVLVVLAKWEFALNCIIGLMHWLSLHVDKGVDLIFPISPDLVFYSLWFELLLIDE